MYRYDEFDHAFVHERVSQFREQVGRRLAGKLTEEEFRPLRPSQRTLSPAPRLYAAHRHSPMACSHRASCAGCHDRAGRFDRGYGHFTTRQNLQFNWVKLVDVPEILSGARRCRDALHPDERQLRAQRHRRSFAGANHDELEDPRAWCEVLRQWSTLHPEFSWLPRKFKIAVRARRRSRRHRLP